jgi:hypothetical protein
LALLVVQGVLVVAEAVLKQVHQPLMAVLEPLIKVITAAVETKMLAAVVEVQEQQALLLRMVEAVQVVMEWPLRLQGHLLPVPVAEVALVLQAGQAVLEVVGQVVLTTKTELMGQPILEAVAVADEM